MAEDHPAQLNIAQLRSPPDDRRMVGFAARVEDSGALGSWLPGYLYGAFAWQGMIVLFLVLLGTGAWSIGRLRVSAG